MAEPGLVATDRGRLSIVQIAAMPGMSGRRAAIERLLGAVLPGVQTTTSLAEMTLLWTGLEQWWVVADDRAASGVVAQLEETAAGDFAVVDLSASRTVLRLSGPSSRYVLAKGSGVDFHPRAFPPGTSVATALARLSVVIHAVGPESFDVYVYRSFGRELIEWLRDAGAECGISWGGSEAKAGLIARRN